MESKEYSWVLATHDQIISTGPCELLYAGGTWSATAADTYLYAGENNTAPLIRRFINTAEVLSDVLAPPVPMYCERGLYADIGATMYGLLVIWRELGKG